MSLQVNNFMISCLYISALGCLLVMFFFVLYFYLLSFCYVFLYVSAMRCLLVMFVCDLVLCVVFLLCSFVL